MQAVAVLGGGVLGGDIAPLPRTLTLAPPIAPKNKDASYTKRLNYS